MEFKNIDNCFKKLDSIPLGNISARIEILNTAKTEISKLDGTVERLETQFKHLDETDPTISDLTISDQQLDVGVLLESLEERINNYSESGSSLEDLFEKFSEIRNELTRAKRYINSTTPTVTELRSDGSSHSVSLGL
jgi:chromosome segregation ATPase